jgi:hypothetical protein
MIVFNQLINKAISVCNRLQTFIVDYKHLITGYGLMAAISLTQHFVKGLEKIETALQLLT